MTHVKTLLITLVSTSLFLNQVYAEDFGSASVIEGKDYSLEEMLKYALEDETQALKEYEYLMESFDITRPYTNITRAKQDI